MKLMFVAYEKDIPLILISIELYKNQIEMHRIYYKYKKNDIFLISGKSKVVAKSKQRCFFFMYFYLKIKTKEKIVGI
jgi:hypothetical protein